MVFAPDAQRRQRQLIIFPSFMIGWIRGTYHVVGLFFDLSRAFDSLLPQFIKDKLFNLGIRGPVRSMSGAVSSELPTDIGVPQGTILGPLIFLLYINYLPSFFDDDVHIIMYADDTSMAVSANDPMYLTQKVKLVVERFTNWCEKNRIILNIKKQLI